MKLEVLYLGQLLFISRMKLFFTIGVLLCSSKSFTQSRVIAKIYNIRSAEGVCRACLFNNKKDFDGEGGKPFKCVVVAVKSSLVEAIFEDVPAGNYALFVFHDANGNNKMDKNFLGIPKEGYGASKNKLPFASAPAYLNNQFAVPPKSVVDLPIKLRNL